MIDEYFASIVPARTEVVEGSPTVWAANAVTERSVTVRGSNACLLIVIWSTLIGGCLASGVAASDADETAAWDGETYVLSVGEMEILHEVNTDDTWSQARDELRKQQKESARERVERLTAQQAELLSTLLAEVGDTCVKASDCGAH